MTGTKQERLAEILRDLPRLREETEVHLARLEELLAGVPELRQRTELALDKAAEEVRRLNRASR